MVSNVVDQICTLMSTTFRHYSSLVSPWCLWLQQEKHAANDVRIMDEFSKSCSCGNIHFYSLLLICDNFDLRNILTTILGFLAETVVMKILLLNLLLSLKLTPATKGNFFLGKVFKNNDTHTLSVLVINKFLKLTVPILYRKQQRYSGCTYQTYQ